jgi:uncharacterized coiled-coil DUF342 family protein
MASLLRSRIVPGMLKAATLSRPLLVRQIMVAAPKTPARLDDILDVVVQQKEMMEELREKIAELEQKNKELQARIDDEEEESGQSDSGIDRDTLEEKLNELEEKLDEAKELVDEIRTHLE